jgi:hypothetical protein
MFINTITQYSPLPLRHNIYIVNTRNRMTASSRITFSFFNTVCWIDKTASNLVRFVAAFNLRNRKKSTGSK